MRDWINKTLPTLLVGILLGAVGWAMGASRSDSAQESQIESLRADVVKMQEEKASKDQVQAIEMRINSIQQDTQYLRKRLDDIYGVPDLRRGGR